MFGAKRKPSIGAPIGATVAVLEPEPQPVPVMERAIAAIKPFEQEADAAEISNKLASLSRKRSSLFGIEHQAIAALDREMFATGLAYEKAAAFEKFEGEKKRVDLEVLSWRSEPLYANGIAVPIPAVGLFSLTSNTLELTANWTQPVLTPTLSSAFTKHYQDVADALHACSSAWATYHISASFTGVIPDETRQKIKDAEKSKVFKDIRLLAETKWDLNMVATPFYADPIVVGLIGDEMWVIDVFDPTPLEDYIANEFTA